MSSVATRSRGAEATGPQPLVERARAKVNLSLTVRGRRPDGYHDLSSLVVFAHVADVLRLHPDTEASVSVSGPFAGHIEGVNLVERALEAAREAACGCALGAVELEKYLPVAAGLGGGSADAAAMLRLLRRANPRASCDWQALAKTLGADVPVCLASHAALMWGIGHELRRVELPQLPAVLVRPPLDMPRDKTARIFKALGASASPAPATPPDPLPDLASVDALVAYLETVGNDLARPACQVWPILEQVWADLQASAGARYCAMSGAGPTSFALYRGTDEAVRAARDLARAHPDWWILATELNGEA